jgi:hypothetical protein
MQLTHRLKAPGFNPRAYKVRNRFQRKFAFKFNLMYRYSLDVLPRFRHVSAGPSAQAAVETSGVRRAAGEHHGGAEHSGAVHAEVAHYGSDDDRRQRTRRGVRLRRAVGTLYKLNLLATCHGLKAPGFLTVCGPLNPKP